jgi:hypothetical protein
MSPLTNPIKTWTSDPIDVTILREAARHVRPDSVVLSPEEIRNYDLRIHLFVLVLWIVPWVVHAYVIPLPYWVHLGVVATIWILIGKRIGPFPCKESDLHRVAHGPQRDQDVLRLAVFMLEAAREGRGGTAQIVGKASKWIRRYSWASTLVIWQADGHPNRNRILNRTVSEIKQVEESLRNNGTARVARLAHAAGRVEFIECWADVCFIGHYAWASAANLDRLNPILHCWASLVFRATQAPLAGSDEIEARIGNLRAMLNEAVPSLDVRPIPSAKPREVEWLIAAIVIGFIAGATALARKLGWGDPMNTFLAAVALAGTVLVGAWQVRATRVATSRPTTGHSGN